MTWCLEQPIPILAIGVLLVVMALGALLRTGRFAFLYVAGAAALICAALLVMEWQVVTPKEEIESTLQQIARDLESNHAPQILRHISASTPQLRDMAQRTLRRVSIQRVAVKRNLKVEFTPPASPRQASASFNAVIVGSERSGVIQNQTSPFFFVVDFVKEDGAWRVVSYQRHLPHKGRPTAP